MSQLLTAGQVAEWLQISVKTLNARVSKGDISCSRLGGSLRFEEEDVRSYINKNKTGTK